MPDDQIIALLTEIRDLQKQNVENYKLALQKQQEAIDFNKQNALELRRQISIRQKAIFFVVIAIAVVGFLLITVSSELVKVHH